MPIRAISICFAILLGLASAAAAQTSAELSPTETETGEYRTGLQPPRGAIEEVGPAIPDAWKKRNNFGRVGRIYPGLGGIYFTLLGGRTAMQPKAGYYLLKLDHPNYQAMVDMLYLATSEEWTIRVRTHEELNVDQYAEVYYFVIDPADRVPLDRQTGNHSPVR